jgi:hypothetical protein
MTAPDIYRQIYQHFANYEYKLNNTFVFDWESDFFCRSKSGYYVEVEVKVSRSDFFVDFKKEKHALFRDVHSKKTHSVERKGLKTGWGYGFEEAALIMKLDMPYLDTQYGSKERVIRKGPAGADWFAGYERATIPDWRCARHNGKVGYWINDYGRVEIRKKPVQLWAPRNEIRIHDLTKALCPHQFYYAAPAGMIKLEELPPYAGLIEISDASYQTLKVVRRAPYMHKRGMDLTSILLKKFYNLWVYKVPYEVKESIRKDFSETQSKAS